MPWTKQGASQSVDYGNKGPSQPGGLAGLGNQHLGQLRLGQSSGGYVRQGVSQAVDYALQSASEAVDYTAQTAAEAVAWTAQGASES